MLPNVSDLTKKIEQNSALLSQLVSLISVLNKNVERQNALLEAEQNKAYTTISTGTFVPGDTVVSNGVTYVVAPGTNSTGPK